MKTSMNKQQGMTLISIAFILALIGFFTLLILKITPIYLDHNKVANAFEALEKTPGIENKSKYEIKTSLAKRFNMNYVYHVTVDDVKITKHGQYLKVEVEYEAVEPIVGNLSVLVEFNEMFEVGIE